MTEIQSTISAEDVSLLELEMRLSVTSGSASSATSLVGAGMLALFPEVDWLGWVLIAAGIAIFLFDVRIDHGHVHASRETRLGRLFGRLVPIHEAARKAYEAAERNRVLDLVCSPSSPPEARLTHFKYVFMVDDEAVLYGVKPPSTKSLPIPRDELSGLCPQDGTSHLTSITAQHHVEYENAAIRNRDLRRIIREYPVAARRFGQPSRTTGQ